MEHILKALPQEEIKPLDEKTISEIIGRDASERIVRNVPKFKDLSDNEPKFGRLGEWLRRLSI